MTIFRYVGNTPGSTKNSSKIDLNHNITIAAQNYGLIGSVHHHGTTITSGHYTSNIYYPSTSFTCNDKTIEIIRPTTYSNSCYLIFYARGGCQHGTQRMGARSHDAGTSSVFTTRVEEKASKPSRLVLPPDDLTTWVDDFHVLAPFTLYIHLPSHSICPWTENWHDSDAECFGPLYVDINFHS